jgi:hypothetical protein
MRVAILSESEDDEGAVRVLIDGILGRSTQLIANPPLRARGWPFIRNILPSALTHFHYHTDAEALVVVVDSDDSVVHHPSHDVSHRAFQACRLCQLLAIVTNTQERLRPRINLPPTIKVAVGLAVPAVEAWYRSGIDPHVTEAAWMQGLESRRYPYTRNGLKAAVYGTERPSRTLKTHRATEEARDLWKTSLAWSSGFQMVSGHFQMQYVIGKDHSSCQDSQLSN